MMSRGLRAMSEEDGLRIQHAAILAINAWLAHEPNVGLYAELRTKRAEAIGVAAVLGALAMWAKHGTHREETGWDIKTCSRWRDSAIHKSIDSHPDKAALRAAGLQLYNAGFTARFCLWGEAKPKGTQFLVSNYAGRAMGEFVKNLVFDVISQVN